MRPIHSILLLALMPTAIAGADLQVGTGRPFATLTSAIAAAREGDSVTVHGGVYQEGNLRLDKSITLTGVDAPVLDGAGKGEVMTITVPNVRISGFEIRNSGASSLEDQAGIRISETDHVTVTENRIHNCTFGIYLSKAKDCRILGNDVEGIPGNEQNSGNGIHLWSCNRITVSDNQVSGHRDGIYLEFATESVMERNVVEDNFRYGLHFMFSHGNAYRRNSFQRNGAGVAVMYSRNVEMNSNHFAHNWGSASYGLLLKDMTDGRITDNSFEHNTTGISMHGSNRMTIERNQFSENGWAVQVQSSSSDNDFRKNNFFGNSFDIAADGELDNNRFENNYWDKYEGYDLKRDGIGDVPFRPVSLYAVVVGRVPSSVLLLRSPIVHLLDQAEKVFPSITPERVLDEKPAMRRHPFRLNPPPIAKRQPMKKP
jgi:nitrous oxidase accessory protein